jgi:amino acid transporter
LKTATSSSRLVRGIHRWDLLAVAVNGIVGAGIFGLPSQVYHYTGPYSVLVFIICALAISTIVVCFAEVGGRFSESGGPYLYACKAFGLIASFEVGWLVWLARITGFGTICNLLVDYLGYLWPQAVFGYWRFSIVSVIVIGLAGFNLTGVRRAAVLSNTLVVVKLVPILFFLVVGLFFIKSENFFAPASPALKPFSRAVLLSVFTFSGFEYAGIVAGETRDPRRNLPFVMLAAVAVCALLFVLIQFGCVGTLPDLGNSGRPLADAGRQFLGPAGGLIITVGAIVSMLGTLNIIMLAAPSPAVCHGRAKPASRHS